MSEIHESLSGPKSEGRAPATGPRPGPGDDPQEAEVLQGTVERVTYYSPESRYTVMKLKPEEGFCDTGSLFTALGGSVAAVGTGMEIARQAHGLPMSVTARRGPVVRAPEQRVSPVTTAEETAGSLAGTVDLEVGRERSVI